MHVHIVLLEPSEFVACYEIFRLVLSLYWDLASMDVLYFILYSGIVVFVYVVDCVFCIRLYTCYMCVWPSTLDCICIRSVMNACGSVV